MHSLIFALEQDGVIDNLVLSPSVHRTWGAVTVLAVLLATAWFARLAIAKAPLDLPGRVIMAIAQVALMVQALLGIKLLDQGLGVLQLYIHYVGGLIPLGLFLALGWLPMRDEVRRTRLLALITAAGAMSAVMAFLIGGAYATR